MTTPPVLNVSRLGKSFPTSRGQLTVLEDISFTLAPGETCAIVGPSGSGKTTLLGLCAGLDTTEQGKVVLCGQNVASLDQDDAAALRLAHVGFIFQNFRLIPTLTALENVMVPAELAGKSGVESNARDLLAAVGLADRSEHYPSQLSGGEQQRVAVARAFINKPSILFADEPTGNLDHDTGDAVTDLLMDLNQSAGTALLVVTHNMELAERTSRVIQLSGGRLVADRLTTSAEIE